MSSGTSSLSISYLRTKICQTDWCDLFSWGVFIRMALFSLAISPLHPTCTSFLTPPNQLREKKHVLSSTSIPNHHRLLPVLELVWNCTERMHCLYFFFFVNNVSPVNWKNKYYLQVSLSDIYKNRFWWKCSLQWCTLYVFEVALNLGRTSADWLPVIFPYFNL